MKEKHEWTKKQTYSAKTPNFGKKYIIQPNFLKLIGPIKRKKVLELGSGNGYWLEILSNRGAICTGIEISKEQISLAQKRDVSNKINYILGDITSMDKYGLKRNSYDVIILEHVLLEISSVKKLEKIFSYVYKVLKKNGLLVISDLHPLAPSSKPHNIRTGVKFNYFSSGEIIEVVSKRIDGKKTIYKDFHWTLEDIISSITKSGLKISRIIEPKPSRNLAIKHPDLAYRLETPMSIMIKALK